jgi:acyl dehydratase
MPIDIDRVVGAELPSVLFSWSEDEVISYGLAVGAGDPPTDPSELKYVYESDLVAVPSFGTIPPFAMMMGFGGVDGLDVSLTQILHGDHKLTVHRPIPTSGTVTQTGRVVDVYDKRKGALLVVEVVSTLHGSDEPLFTNRSGIFVRGEGGFGGENGPPPGNLPPERPPDLVVESPTLPQQALIYRMSSGDRNPLHADPAFAALAGFDRPILHGLCTFGIVTRAVVETALDGDPSRLGSIETRFTGHVFPGETLVTRIWEDEDRVVLTTETAERGTKVLSNCAVEALA